MFWCLQNRCRHRFYKNEYLYTYVQYVFVPMYMFARVFMCHLQPLETIMAASSNHSPQVVVNGCLKL